MARGAFEIGGHAVEPGTRQTLHLPVSVLSDHTPVAMSVHVVHGRKPGPVMFVSASVHGDEVIGVEIVRRLLRSPTVGALSGTLLAVPIVNAFGFMNHARYLPDRRDLNRCFPGSGRGSLASRLAHLFTTEIVRRSTCGIDLHSAAIHRTNLPQIRVSPTAPGAMELARAFGAPLVLVSRLREGSLRAAALALGVDVLLYEAGEGLRFDERAVRIGVVGILRVMRSLGMIGARGAPRLKTPSLISNDSTWVRSPAGGLMRTYKAEGERVHVGDLLGVVSDPFGEVEVEIVARTEGVIVGRSVLPIVNEGDGIFHIATLHPDASAAWGAVARPFVDHPLFDEDEIV